MMFGLTVSDRYLDGLYVSLFSSVKCHDAVLGSTEFKSQHVLHM